jgi:hypothetical protein
MKTITTEARRHGDGIKSNKPFESSLPGRFVRMMRTASFLLIFSMCLSASVVNSPAHAREGSAGTTAGNVLLRSSVGARSAAMGGAYTAVAGGPLALYYNPAGLSDLDRNRVFLQYDDSFLDINRSDLAFAHPTLGGGFGLSISAIDYGDIIRTTTTNKAGSGNVDANDYLVRIGYGRAVSERIMLGGTLGYYRLDLDDIQAHGVTADASVLYRPNIEGLSLAAAVKNMGSRARFHRDDEELPLTVVLGGSYRPIPKLLLAVDYEVPRNQSGIIKAGAEFALVDVLALRVGYDGRNETDNGLTLGAGFRMKDLMLDYAYVPFGDFGQSHRVSAEVAFGAPVERPMQNAYPAPMPQQARAIKPEPAQVAARPAVTTASATMAREPIDVAPAPSERVDLAEAKARASAAMAAGQFAAAADWYRMAIARTPGDVVLRYNLATAYFRAGLYDDAANQFEQVANADPMDEEAWLFLGYAESRAGRPSEARIAWEKVLEINPTNANARRALGR